MSEPADRIRSSADLGQARRGVDVVLGSSAVVPIVACAAVAWLTPAVPPLLVRTAAVIWAASLLTFFAGVRRGLTFSEVGGGRPAELATMLGFFGFGVASLALLSPAIAAVGLAVVGLLDAWSSKRRESPAYFTVFRPPQMALAAVSLALVQLRGG